MIAARRGAIVTVASAAGRIATGATAPYAVAKAGIVTLTQHLAREVAGHGVRVNCVSPSVVLTDRNRPDGAERDALIAQHPLGRLGNSQDVVAATLFLLSGASGWMTGITIDVAGGRVTV
jgi:3-oxoacyl-[acyl-carrier protein] reductase